MGAAPRFTIDEQIAAGTAAVNGDDFSVDALRAAVVTLGVMKECRGPILDIYRERESVMAVYEAFPGCSIFKHMDAMYETLQSYARGQWDGGARARKVVVLKETAA